MDDKEAMTPLICWAASKGYSVYINNDGDDSVDTMSRIIEINSKNSHRTQLYVLLHECGHVLIYLNKSSFDFENVFGAYKEGASIHKVFRVIEEAEAWKRGKALAARLSIDIDQAKWDRHVARAMKSYMLWATN